MTGQVKEEVITRLIELGVFVSSGYFVLILSSLESLSFSRKKTIKLFRYKWKTMSESLNAGELGFTYCQIPIVYHQSDSTTIRITFENGEVKKIDGDTIDDQISQLIFDKTGEVIKINVGLKPKL